ncbi:hypothetical protein KFL_000090600 [Klebsormidium nitens]|uniref:Uncharacterized protein n=1 Tax=Klebsormidium nitens TaxID=105231 RepID=A0A1Y1HIB2_KLENI|nr:hypothetical protein KFL_000090600 [Klebsormidium nitens]|eukprot:GAQ78214.1 hypothetical protein KFL_000090600 [Klebsormidium nitens]
MVHELEYKDACNYLPIYFGWFLRSKEMEHRNLQHEHVGPGGACACSSHAPSGVEQGLEELNFQRSLSGAALSGDLNKVRRILDRTPLQGGQDDDQGGYTPLHYAARNGHQDICRLLLERGAVVDARTPAGRATPLHRAAYGGHVDIVKLLLRHGADPRAKDADGQTPHDKAVGSEAAVIVKPVRKASGGGLLARGVVFFLIEPHPEKVGRARWSRTVAEHRFRERTTAAFESCEDQTLQK